MAIGTLRGGYIAVALKLQEAADLSSNDVANRLRDTINDQHRGSSSWGYYIDHFGDGESGDVIYSCDGDTMRAGYEMSSGEGRAAKCVIDFEGAEDVVPRTVYEPEQDEADHYAAMEESLKAEGLYTALPLYERFISKGERDAASSEDFAGKGKSFPILKPEDIMAAVHSMGRAGSKNLGPSGIKGRIIAIAKRKGWTKYLPKAWRGGESDSKEAAATVPVSGRSDRHLKLVESAAFLADIPLREAEGVRTSYPIKIISPGTGSSAHYPAAVLEKEAPKFKAGTLMFWNHPTGSQESQRPEGDLNDLAAILTSPGRWDASGPKGPGVYAEAKVMSDYAERVAERAPHIGLSIRAGGETDGTKIDGKPVLTGFSHIESVDYVTKAGRGGLALAEAAREIGIEVSQEVSEMDAAEITKLQEAMTAQAALNARLLERAIRGDAREFAVRHLKGLSLLEAAKELAIENAMREVPQKDGALDEAKFKETLDAEAKRVGAVVAAATGSGQVFGMGAPTPIDAKEAERIAAAEKDAEAQSIAVFESLGMPKDAATYAAKGRAA